MGGRQEGGSGGETHVIPWLIHVNIWQKPLQYYKVISLQLIKINGKKRLKRCYQPIARRTFSSVQFSSVQSLSHVQLFETP